MDGLDGVEFGIAGTIGEETHVMLSVVSNRWVVRR